MPLSSESYRRLAVELGYQQDTLEKVLRLGELLDQIGSHEQLRDALTLRGGTALNLIHETPPRLSIDLDFDFIGAIERAKMLEQKPDVTDGIRRISTSLGYQFNVAKDAPAGSTFQLRYTNSRGTRDEVKVDISWTNRVQIVAPTRRTLWQPATVTRPVALVSSELDLAGGKFRALIDRVAARDVYDGIEIARRQVGDWPNRVRSAFVFLSGTLDLPLTAYGPDRIDLLSNEEAERNLRPMILAGIELDVPSLKASAKRVLAPLLSLTDAEQEFVRRLDAGELAPELLFDAETAERMRLHPHLLWKVHNVRKHRMLD